MVYFIPDPNDECEYTLVAVKGLGFCYHVKDMGIDILSHCERCDRDLCEKCVFIHEQLGHDVTEYENPKQYKA